MAEIDSVTFPRAATTMHFTCVANLDMCKAIRFEDLKRMGKSITLMNEYIKTVTIGSIVSIMSSFKSRQELNKHLHCVAIIDTAPLSSNSSSKYYLIQALTVL